VPDSLRKLIKIYLSDAEALDGELDMRARKVAHIMGYGDILTNQSNMDKAIERFQTECEVYWSTLQVDSPSHLKVFGHLLYSMTQLRDEEDRRLRFWAIDQDTGVTIPEEARQSVVFFHEFCSFIVVHQMLCSAQGRRARGGKPTKLNFNPQKPPTNPRYARSMLGYLREWRGGPLKQDKTPYDFYMIFKTMDLYGLKEHTPD
jgi:hypothetical protein